MRISLVKKILSLLFFLPLIAMQASPWDTDSEEEAFFLRRIASFWEEGEYQIVKTQLEEFLESHADSPCAEALSATLGDLYVRENDYQKALSYYAELTSQEELDRVFLNRMQCFLELQWFATLADECESHLLRTDISEEARLQTSRLLAAALYRQCLNSPSSQELLERALIHFKTLMDSSLSQEFARAYAHLCFLSGDCRTASDTYLKLAGENPEDRSDLLFQAALLQARYDKALASRTFRTLSELNSPRSGEAAYNGAVLAFECGDVEELIRTREEWLAKIPESFQPSAHLLLGRCYLRQERYAEAKELLTAYAREETTPSAHLQGALADLLDISYRLEDEPVLAATLARLAEAFPNDSRIATGMLARAMLLKRQGRLEEASDALGLLPLRFPRAPECETALSERIEAEYRLSRFDSCRALCRSYLDACGHAEGAAHVWRYLACSSSHLARETFAEDLEALLKASPPFPPEEQTSWQTALAKTYYELQRYGEALPLLETLLTQGESGGKGDASLLMALCQRDGLGSQEGFCLHAEQACSQGTALLDPPSLHRALFNSYLAQEGSFDKAADHLYEASRLAPLDGEHSLWLADYYHAQFLKSPDDLAAARRAAEVLQQFLNTTGIDLDRFDEHSLSFELPAVRLAELLAALDRKEESARILSGLKAQQKAHPSWDWKEQAHVDLLLARGNAATGKWQEALDLFNSILAKYPLLRTPSSAAACLESARLRIAHCPESVDAALWQLKSLVLQRSLTNEPTHLEAALDYVDLQTSLADGESRLQKRLALLLKTKAEFEGTGDLLAQDYQKSREALPDKDQIYRSYLRFFDGEILSCRAALSPDGDEKRQLQENAASLYEELRIAPAAPALRCRAEKKLGSG